MFRMQLLQREVKMSCVIFLYPFLIWYRSEVISLLEISDEILRPHGRRLDIVPYPTLLNFSKGHVKLK